VLLVRSKFKLRFRYYRRLIITLRLSKVSTGLVLRFSRPIQSVVVEFPYAELPFPVPQAAISNISKLQKGNTKIYFYSSHGYMGPGFPADCCSCGAAVLSWQVLFYRKRCGGKQFPNKSTICCFFTYNIKVICFRCSFPPPLVEFWRV